ncbi:MAG TPA: excinuclease ABC subunit UvrC [Candidatus Saccharimonadales bacterium]
MNDKLTEKLKTLPRSPGVYFHKSKTGEIIYVGKAAVLKNRVRQYFQSKRDMDVKTLALVAEIYDTDWVTTESEIDALFLESEMVKRYMPRFNILLRDDKSQLFVRINMKDAYPYVSFTRGPVDDGADYYGPYYNGFAVKKALRYLRRVFPYSTHVVMPKRVCLQYHLGLCPGGEEQKISSSDYKQILRKLIRYLKGERKALVEEIRRDMKNAAAEHRYEEAAKLRNKLNDLTELQKRIMFGDAEFLDISKDLALVGLQELLGLPHAPRRIEGYDISHMSGTNNVASMVVATNGLADKAEYRKFKMRIPGNNDFAHMHEALSRRFSGKHLDWLTPELLLIDGGKGQLDAALRALEEKQLQIPAVGLAKREEEIVVHKTRSNVGFANRPDQLLPGTFVGESDDFYVIRLPKDSHIVKLLQRIRNESHRFAVSYHSTLKRQGATQSLLDEIHGVGPATRKKLVTAFGSVRGIKQATPEQLIAVVGKRQAQRIVDWLQSQQSKV